jgi:hypothetical protein
MFPLGSVSHRIPAHQIAGRLALDVLCILRDVRDGGHAEGVILCAYTDFADGEDFESVFGRPGTSVVPRHALRNHLLAVRISGEFFSTDRLVPAQMDARSEHWFIDFELTRMENFNGEPAPRELWVLLAIEPGKQPLQSVTLRFQGRLRDFLGNETPIPEPVVAPQTISFSD